jgi:hypothetical protein
MIDPAHAQQAIAELMAALGQSDLTEQDRAMLQQIHEAVQRPLRFQKLIRSYYHDRDRADRTPREVMYLHIGFLAGMLEPRQS